MSAALPPSCWSCWTRSWPGGVSSPPTFHLRSSRKRRGEDCNHGMHSSPCGWEAGAPEGPWLVTLQTHHGRCGHPPRQELIHRLQRVITWKADGKSGEASRWGSRGGTERGPEMHSGRREQESTGRESTLKGVTEKWGVGACLTLSSLWRKSCCPSCLRAGARDPRVPASWPAPGHSVETSRAASQGDANCGGPQGRRR